MHFQPPSPREKCRRLPTSWRQTSQAQPARLSTRRVFGATGPDWSHAVCRISVTTAAARPAAHYCIRRRPEICLLSQDQCAARVRQPGRWCRTNERPPLILYHPPPPLHKPHRCRLPSQFSPHYFRQPNTSLLTSWNCGACVDVLFSQSIRAIYVAQIFFTYLFIMNVARAVHKNP